LFLPQDNVVLLEAVRAPRVCDQVAEAVGISPRTAQDALTIRKTSPEDWQEVLDGKASISGKTKEVRQRDIEEPIKSRVITLAQWKELSAADRAEALATNGACPASAFMRQIGLTRRGGFLAHRSDVRSADEREIRPARNGRTTYAGYPPSYPQEMVFRRENPDRPVRFARLPSFAGERESQTGFTTEKGSRNRPSKNAACYTRRGLLKLKPE
jgi:hypothetical protein